MTQSLDHAMPRPRDGIQRPKSPPGATMCIAGIGTAVPKHSIAQSDAATLATSLCPFDASQRRRIEKLYRLTHVERRHSVLLNSDGADEQLVQEFLQPKGDDASHAGPTLAERMALYESCAPPLALDAAQKALDDADIAPDRITHIITVSCSGFMAPGVDAYLIEQLGLGRNTERTHVGFMGCHGAMNAIRVARGYVESNPAACVLIVAVELCSIHYQYSEDDETNLANGLFADGAAAMVLQQMPANTAPAWRCAATGSCLLPDSKAAMTWKIRNHGFLMGLSKEVPEIIKANLVPWLVPWLAEQGLLYDDIESWAVHPGGPAILNAVKGSLFLRREDLVSSWGVLRDFGNMSSPTIFFVMDAMRRREAPLPCVALGFGPGLAVEATLWV